MSDLNLFLVHTPFQNYIANHMVSNMTELRSSDNYIIIDMDRKVKVNKNLWDEVFVFSPPIGKNYLVNFAERKKFLKEIQNRFVNYSRVNIFLANVFYPFNNAFFGLARKDKLNKYVLCNFPEGIANLIFVPIDKKTYLKNFIKYSLGVIIGFPYQLFSGDISGIKYADKIYSLIPSMLPEQLNKQKNIIEIPKLTSRVLEQKEESCLILGQSNFDNIPNYKSLIKKVVEYCNSLGITKIYYKPHHYENYSISYNYKELGCVIIKTNEPIEEYFLSHPINYVVGFNSSALLNLKYLFGNFVSCISFKGNITANYNGFSHKWELAKSLYKELGVEIVE